MRAVLAAACAVPLLLLPRYFCRCYCCELIFEVDLFVRGQGALYYLCRCYCCDLIEVYDLLVVGGEDCMCKGSTRYK